MGGDAIFPVIFHEDPRYFRKGTGTVTSRVLYSVSAIVRCKSDEGTWVPNYSNVVGNFVFGGISNLYYPSTNRGFELTVQNAVTVTAEAAIGITMHLLRRFSLGGMVLLFRTRCRGHSRSPQAKRRAEPVTSG
jgi:hypothetical protein